MSGLSRREFVKTSLAIGAGAFAAPALAASSSPNGTLRLAVIGVRGRGGEHISEFLNDERATIVTLAEVDEAVAESRAKQVEEKQGFRPKIVKDMRDAFDDDSVDAISTATPNHWHALCGVWAMQAGKHAYIEKPICHNIAEGAALIAAAQKNNRLCQVGTQCRSNPAIQEAVAFLQSGGLGEVRFARGLCWKRRKSIGALGNYRVPPGVDFNLWSGPATYTSPRVTRPQFHYDWHWQRHYGNGDLGNQGPHQTDIARWGLGVDSHPQQVISYGGRLGYQAERNDPHYIEAGDTANTEVSIYDYGDKCIVFETRGLDVKSAQDEEINRLFPSSGNRIGVIFYGTEGYLVQRSYTHCEVFDKDFNKVREFKGGDNKLHFQNFVGACLSGDASILNASAREGHLSAGMSHLGNISYYLGEENRVTIDEAAHVLSGIKSLDDNLASLHRTARHLKDNRVDLRKYPISLGPLLRFDPVKEVFPGNASANAWLSREYRTGFECPSAENV